MVLDPSPPPLRASEGGRERREGRKERSVCEREGKRERRETETEREREREREREKRERDMLFAKRT